MITLKITAIKMRLFEQTGEEEERSIVFKSAY